MSSKKVFWITGLSGAGKTTTSLYLNEKLHERGISPVLVDGDSFREVLGNRFGYTNEDRLYLAQCYGRLCKDLSDQNHTVICSTISMFDSVRDWNRKHIQGYIEIYLKVSPSSLKERDPKGLYRQAALKKDISLVGLQEEFQEPKNPDLVFDTCKKMPLSLIVEEILTYTYKGLENES